MKPNLSYIDIFEVERHCSHYVVLFGMWTLVTSFDHMIIGSSQTQQDSYRHISRKMKRTEPKCQTEESFISTTLGTTDRRLLEPYLFYAESLSDIQCRERLH